MMSDSGWAGDLQGFSVRRAETVDLSEFPGPERVLLSPKDAANRGFFNLKVCFAICTNQQLDEARFLEAVKLAFRSFPALGSRLQLDPLPASLSLSQLSFPVSFATWPCGSLQRFAADHQWQTSSDEGHHIPTPPFAHALDVQAAVDGQGPLFSLQLTSLGDGASVVAATWLHVLSDATRISKVLHAIAAAYKSQGEQGEVQQFKWLPRANVERNAWPWDIKKLFKQEQDIQYSKEIMFSQDGLLEGPASIKDASNCRRVYGPIVMQTGEPRSGWNALALVQLEKEDVGALKATLQAHPLLQGIKFSTNDVILAITWMLVNDARGLQRPGQGPAGSTRLAFLVMDHSLRAWPELDSEGFLGNIIASSPILCSSDGSAEHNTDSESSLHSGLAQVVAAIRNTIIQVREVPNMQKQMTSSFEARLGSAGFLGAFARLEASGQSLDVAMTNWNHAGHETIDFGGGLPDSLYGHFSVQHSKLIGIMGLPGGKIGLGVPLDGRAALQKLKSSPLLSTMIPRSGLVDDTIFKM